MTHTAEDLRALQAKTLEEKIQSSTARIIEWYESWCGQKEISKEILGREYAVEDLAELLAKKWRNR